MTREQIVSQCVRMKMCWWLIVRVIRSAGRHLIAGVRARPITPVDWIWNTALACVPHHDKRQFNILWVWQHTLSLINFVASPLQTFSPTPYNLGWEQEIIQLHKESASKVIQQFDDNISDLLGYAGLICLICGKCWANMSDLREMLG